MQALECPHCHQPGISLWRKLCLGFATSARCRNCGAALTVPKSSMWASVPFLAAIAVASFVPSRPLSVLLWVVGAIAMGLLHLFYVPLVERS